MFKKIVYLAISILTLALFSTFIPKDEVSAAPTCEINPIITTNVIGEPSLVRIINITAPGTYTVELIWEEETSPGVIVDAHINTLTQSANPGTSLLDFLFPETNFENPGTYRFKATDVGSGNSCTNSPLSIAVLDKPTNNLGTCEGFIDCLKDIENPGDVDTKFSASGLIGKIVSAFLPIILGLSGFVAVIFIIISGIQFITSSGNPEGAAAARGRLIFALVGFGLIVMAYVILKIVDQIFLGEVIT